LIALNISSLTSLGGERESLNLRFGLHDLEGELSFHEEVFRYWPDRPSRKGCKQYEQSPSEPGETMALRDSEKRLREN